MAAIAGVKATRMTHALCGAIDPRVQVVVSIKSRAERPVRAMLLRVRGSEPLLVTVMFRAVLCVPSGW
jgi:hypothetical protein